MEELTKLLRMMPVMVLALALFLPALRNKRQLYSFSHVQTHRDSTLTHRNTSTQRLRPSKHNKKPVAHTWRPVYIHLERVSQGVCGLNQFIFIWCKKYSEFLSFTTSSDNGIYHICWYDLDDVLLLVNRSRTTMECTSWLEAKRFTIHTLYQK